MSTVKKISADKIYTLASQPIDNGVLVINKKGGIEAIIKKEEAGEEVEILAGAICPGFVNAHCHLELSYMKGNIPQGTGIAEFASCVEKIRREVSDDEILQAMANADKAMWENGVVATGDISNDAISFELKKNSDIRYYTFIELLALNPVRAEQVFDKGKALHEKLISYGLRGMLSAHAPYTVSAALLKMMGDYNNNNFPQSIHNQESLAEEEFLRSGTGPIKRLYEQLNIPLHHYSPPGKNSLQSILPSLPQHNNLLLVHNTFTSANDIRTAELHSPHIFWVLCPKANLYIENKLPNIPGFVESNVKVCIGTDSLASNNSLSVFDEIKVIASRFPNINTETLLEWACLNGARSLQMEQTLGSIEIGKQPGLVLLKGLDLQSRITEDTTIKKLL